MDLQHMFDLKMREKKFNLGRKISPFLILPLFMKNKKTPYRLKIHSLRHRDRYKMSLNKLFNNAKISPCFDVLL